MGGSGSGRWYWHSTKRTVEDCLILGMDRLVRFGQLRTGAHLFDLLQWKNSHTGEVTSSIGFESNAEQDGTGWVRLFYTNTRTEEKQDYRITLTTTRQNLGGFRWWFICPLIAQGRACRRRVGKLYLPPGCAYFGCRHCYDLTYTSCQESHKFDAMYAALAADVQDRFPGITAADVKRLLNRWQ